MPARVLILRAPGTNCDEETAYAFEEAGGETERVHINALTESPSRLDEFQILCIPGGFSYGDDIGAGKVLAHQIRLRFADALKSFRDAGKLILGICNGFQVLIKSGLLFNDEPQQPVATLTWNDSQKFEDRWVQLKTIGDKCVFLQDSPDMYLPVAHAEGKFLTRTPEGLAELENSGQLVLRYDATDYPGNPNGSQLNVAGACDESGRVLGLMPHPERYIDRTHHPRWTRGEGADPGDGMRLFQNAVACFA